MRLGDFTFDDKSKEIYFNYEFYRICGNEIKIIKEMKGWKYLTDDRKWLLKKILGKVYYRFLCDNQNVIINSQKYLSLPSDFSEYVRLVKRELKVKRIMSKLEKKLTLTNSREVI